MDSSITFSSLGNIGAFLDHGEDSAVIYEEDARSIGRVPVMVDVDPLSDHLWPRKEFSMMP